MNERFSCLEEPDGTWSVWDSATDRPASLGGLELSGREEWQARAAFDVLNRIYKNRLERGSRSDFGVLDN